GRALQGYRLHRRFGPRTRDRAWLRRAHRHRRRSEGPFDQGFACADCRRASAWRSWAGSCIVGRIFESAAYPLVNKFLIVRLGSLGDVVHAIPVAAALRAEFPPARIAWVVVPSYTALLR